MAKATIVKLADMTFGTIFETQEGYQFEVTRFSNNILTLKPIVMSTVMAMSEIIAGCFEPSSTFKDVKQVIFNFNGKKISVKKEENATPKMIHQKWYDTPYEKP